MQTSENLPSTHSGGKRSWSLEIALLELECAIVPVGQPRADVSVGETLAQAGARGERVLADVAHHDAAAEPPRINDHSERFSARKDTSPVPSAYRATFAQGLSLGAIQPSRTFRGSGSGSRSDPFQATPPAPPE